MVINNHNKPDPIYETDNLVEYYGHKVLRQPPCHLDMNPIGIIWDIEKEKYARNNDGLENIT